MICSICFVFYSFHAQVLTPLTPYLIGITVSFKIDIQVWSSCGLKIYYKLCFKNQFMPLWHTPLFLSISVSVNWSLTHAAYLNQSWLVHRNFHLHFIFISVWQMIDNQSALPPLIHSIMFPDRLNTCAPTMRTIINHSPQVSSQCVH